MARSLKTGRFLKGNVSFSKLNPEKMPRGKGHPLWKGEKVGYRGLHYWLHREKGVPKKCIDCKATSDQRKIQWSNVDGKYHRHIDDYVGRCASCHKIHDLKLKRKNHGKILLQP